MIVKSKQKKLELVDRPGVPQLSIRTELSAMGDGGITTTGDIVVQIVLGFTTTLRKSKKDHAQKMALVRKIETIDVNRTIPRINIGKNKKPLKSLM